MSLHAPSPCPVGMPRCHEYPERLRRACSARGLLKFGGGRIACSNKTSCSARAALPAFVDCRSSSCAHGRHKSTHDRYRHGAPPDSGLRTFWKRAPAAVLRKIRPRSAMFAPRVHLAQTRWHSTPRQRVTDATDVADGQAGIVRTLVLTASKGRVIYRSFGAQAASNHQQCTLGAIGRCLA